MSTVSDHFRALVEYGGEGSVADYVAGLEQQRNQLLAALVGFVAAFDGDQFDEGVWPLMDNAKAAIAKAEGR